MLRDGFDTYVGSGFSRTVTLRTVEILDEEK